MDNLISPLLTPNFPFSAAYMVQCAFLPSVSLTHYYTKWCSYA